jgi:hypothetical protein
VRAGQQVIDRDTDTIASIDEPGERMDKHGWLVELRLLVNAHHLGRGTHDHLLTQP